MTNLTQIKLAFFLGAIANKPGIKWYWHCDKGRNPTGIVIYNENNCSVFSRSFDDDRLFEDTIAYIKVLLEPYNRLEKELRFLEYKKQHGYASDLDVQLLSEIKDKLKS